MHVSSFIFNDRLKLNYWAGLLLAALDGVELRGSELGCTGLEMGWVALSWADLALVRPKRWLICAFEDNRSGLGQSWAGARLVCITEMAELIAHTKKVVGVVIVAKITEARARLESAKRF